MTLQPSTEVEPEPEPEQEEAEAEQQESLYQQEAQPEEQEPEEMAEETKEDVTPEADKDQEQPPAEAKVLICQEYVGLLSTGGVTHLGTQFIHLRFADFFCLLVTSRVLLM